MKSLEKFVIKVVMIFLGITIILFVVTALVSFIDSGAEFGARVVKGCFFLVLSCVFAVPLVVLWDQSRPPSPDHKDNVIVKFSKDIFEFIFPKSKPKKTPAELQWERARQMQVLAAQKSKDPNAKPEDFPLTGRVVPSVVESTDRYTHKQNYTTINQPRKAKTVLTANACSNYIVIDLETTGFSAAADRIIELSAVKVENGVPIQQFTSLINPGIHINSRIADITGITDAMVANQPSIEAVLPAYIDFLRGYILVGHNVTFDLRFLSENCDRMGILFSYKYIDTLQIARKYLNLENNKLPTVCQHFGINGTQFHRSLNDCLATHECFQHMMKLGCNFNVKFVD